MIIRTAKLLPAMSLVCATALAQAAPVKIGILSDLGGPYSSVTGPGSVAAARMAIEDAGGSVLGEDIELVSADHQHKPDVGSTIARRWFDVEGVDAIFDIYNSGVALAVQKLAEEKDKILISTVNSGELTGTSCSPNGFQWGPDGHALASITVKGIQEIEAPEKDRWFFVTVDYTAGHSLEKDASKTVEELGGKVLGHVRFPLGTTDFSSYLLQAQASTADNIGFVGGGSDILNAVKQAHEFQIQSDRQKFLTTSLTTSDIEGLGNETTAGLPIVYSYHWNLNDEAKAWAERFHGIADSMPTDMQANVYSAVRHYLKAVELAGTKETGPVIEAMKQTPVEDMFTDGARIRDDGRLMRDIHFGWVKAPDDMADENDLIDVVSTFSGEEAFLPADQSTCKLLDQ